MSKNVIIGISGATGAVYGITILKILQEIADVKTHLIASKYGRMTLEYETGLSYADVAAYADYVYQPNDMMAPIASGSFLTTAMIVAPCSAKTMGAIANNVGDNLLCRAADVTIKEGRKLVLMLRETPLHITHLENALRLAKMGVFIAPPMNTFYLKPESIEDLIFHTVSRILDIIGIHLDCKRWDDSLRNCSK